MTGSLSQRQAGKIHALLGQLHVTERPERLRVMSAVLYRPVGSTNDLSRDEAHVVIETLSAITERGDAAEHLARFVETTERRSAATP